MVKEISKKILMEMTIIDEAISDSIHVEVIYQIISLEIMTENIVCERNLFNVC